MIKYVNGDILKATEPIIVQQVNCMGVMGAGLAKAIRDKYPNVYNEYKQYCSSSSKKALLGTVQVIDCKEKKIFNLFAQDGFGRNGVYTDYEALKKCLRTAHEIAARNHEPLAIPYGIGCGLAGGDWNIVSKIIEKEFKTYPVTIYRKE